MKKTKQNTTAINNDPMYWVNNYNITGVVEGFAYMYSQKMNYLFEGNVNIIVFDRKDLKAIKRHLKKYINTDAFLSGFLPKGTSDFWDEDFLLTPSSIFPTNILQHIIKPIKDKAFLLTVRCVINSNQHTDVVLNMN
jgi:hypothetical protein